MKYTSSLLSSSLTENDGGKRLILWEELHLLDKFLALTFSGCYYEKHEVQLFVLKRSCIEHST